MTGKLSRRHYSLNGYPGCPNEKKIVILCENHKINHYGKEDSRDPADETVSSDEGKASRCDTAVQGGGFL